jgi:hypothetical protein
MNVGAVFRDIPMIGLDVGLVASHVALVTSDIAAVSLDIAAVALHVAAIGLDILTVAPDVALLGAVIGVSRARILGSLRGHCLGRGLAAGAKGRSLLLRILRARRRNGLRVIGIGRR